MTTELILFLPIPNLSYFPKLMFLPSLIIPFSLIGRI